jgi:hypothetical protein
VSSEDIPADVRAFIRAYIPSVGHMEALALAVEAPDQAWLVEEVAGRLYISEARAEPLLRDLAAAELLEPSVSQVSWRLTTNGARAEPARRAVRLYRERLLQVTALIHSGGDAGRILADAFRFRKE